MRLHEEYIERHKLNVPVVRYDKQSTVFLKNLDSQWCIFCTRWHECEWHPGHFEIQYVQPRHDGCLNQLVDHIIAPRNVYWDEYEIHVLEFVCRLKGEGYQAIPFEDRHLATWQMFVTMHDSVLAKMGYDFISLVGRSVSPSFSFGQRMEFMRAGRSQLKCNNSRLYDTLVRQVVPFSNNYAKWLVDLFQ
jgi:hypothetical protein